MNGNFYKTDSNNNSNIQGLLSCLLMLVFVPLSSIDAYSQIFSNMSVWNPQYTFEHISQEQGLSFNTVTAFAQDKQGFLWVGTFDGLNRYDGVQF
jgi:ligand-binding sensor domain-containing protein